MSAFTPKAGDVVTTHSGHGSLWCADLWTVDRATASTMWLKQRGGTETRTVRKSKYGMGDGWGFVPATAEIISAVDERRRWMRARPKSDAVRLLGGWQSHALETPRRVDIAVPSMKPDDLRALAAQIVDVADWLDAEPGKREP